MENMMSDPLLTISNHHAPGCGDPPIIDDRDLDKYVGYFANAYGEQWIFTHHRPSGISELRGGDIGWNSPVAVKNGSVQDLVLSPSEAAWLAACWDAAVNGQ
jgi:hypothetical protein